MKPLVLQAYCVPGLVQVAVAASHSRVRSGIQRSQCSQATEGTIHRGPACRWPAPRHQAEGRKVPHCISHADVSHRENVMMKTKIQHARPKFSSVMSVSSGTLSRSCCPTGQGASKETGGARAGPSRGRTPVARPEPHPRIPRSSCSSL